MTYQCKNMTFHYSGKLESLCIRSTCSSQVPIMGFRRLLKVLVDNETHQTFGHDCGSCVWYSCSPFARRFLSCVDVGTLYIRLSITITSKWHTEVPINNNKKNNNHVHKHRGQGILSMSLENSINISAFNAVSIQKWVI